MRIIDADSLLKHAGIFEVKARARGCGNSILNLAKAWLWNEVNIAPTIDAVPVVRCRECKKKNKKKCPMTIVNFGRDGKEILVQNHVPDDFYCAAGERKEGADR